MLLLQLGFAATPGIANTNCPVIYHAGNQALAQPVSSLTGPPSFAPQHPTHNTFIDFMTLWVLLQCDSTRDLYPVTKPSTILILFSPSYNAAFNDSNWQNAMKDEYDALIKNNTWTLMPQPTNAHIVRCMWLFRHKYLADGTLSRYKARLVVNGMVYLWAQASPSGLRTDTAYLLLYVDDIVLIASSEILLQRIITSLLHEFSMTDLGSLNYFLGISVTRDSSGMFLSQRKYVAEISDRAHMVNCNPCRTLVDIESKLGYDDDIASDPTLYQSLSGSLQYLTFTCPDISYAVQQVCLHMHDPRGPHFLALKRILTVEVKYRGVAETCWLRNLLRELHTPLSSATLVYYDNVSDVYLSSNLVHHQHMKHIEIDIHFVCDLVAAGQVRVLHVPSRYQYEDIFTK
ncbi:ribonuclease H-like domain-containing protein [Tanacetum coccineum]